MKTSNPLLCNIPYFNNFNNYCCFFLIKSLEMETLERDQKQWRLVWRREREAMFVQQNQYAETATKHSDFSSVAFTMTML